MTKTVVYEIATGKDVSWSSTDKVHHPLPSHLAAKRVSDFPQRGERWNPSTLKVEKTPPLPSTPEEKAMMVLSHRDSGQWSEADTARAVRFILRRNL